METTEFTHEQNVTAWESDWHLAYTLCAASSDCYENEPENPWCLDMCADFLTS
jgi:hypothetical protein